jgi:hypothetical protein
VNGGSVLCDDLDFCRVKQRRKLLNCCITSLEQRNRRARARQRASYTPLCNKLHASYRPRCRRCTKVLLESKCAASGRLPGAEPSMHLFLVALGQPFGMKVDTRRCVTLCRLLGVDLENSHDRKTDTALSLPPLLGGFCLSTLLLPVAALTLAEQSYLRELCDAVRVVCLDVSLLSRLNCRRTLSAFSSPCFVVGKVLCCFLHAAARRESANAFSKGLPALTLMQVLCLSVRYGHDVSGWSCTAGVRLLCAHGRQVVVVLNGSCCYARMLH